MLFVNATICQVGQWAVHGGCFMYGICFKHIKELFQVAWKRWCVMIWWWYHLWNQCADSSESKKQFCIVCYRFWECKCNDDENIKFFEKNDVPNGQWIFWCCIIVLFREKTS